ncbi:MAG: TonB-dependent receptor [Taibaiella sp.]|nr:TonB-dependent receptor [Taibaiella sp.]
MHRTLTCLMILCCIPAASVLYGQETDSVQSSSKLNPVTVMAYFSRQPVLGLTAAAHNITSANIEAQQTTTLLPAINTVAGLRMEERSPGSYRLAMRGSLIRSPFGIRNVKVYLDEFALTDAGGNTYLNLIDPAALDQIHILKGPDGSLYGANSGGVLRLQPKGFEVKENQGTLLLSGGSYGLFQEQLSVQHKVSDKYSFSIDQSFTRTDGYRENTALNKKTIQTAHKWNYAKRSELRFLAFYTDLDYRTPGGLTEAQMQENPRMARPAIGMIPSAKEQKAGIRNKTFFAGVIHDTRINDHLSHTISFFGSYTDFKNPFITNYELRKESNLGVRSYFSYKSEVKERFHWQMQLGFEGQKSWSKIDNYDNESGQRGSRQAMDDLDNIQGSLFYRAMLRLYQRWTIEASLGLNYAGINYAQRYPVVAEPNGSISFDPVWMPRVAMSYLLTDALAIRGSVSKGYSPPTIAEVRSSDNVINTDLRAETGINYEVGVRAETNNRRFIADVSLYHYDMNDAIVRQLRVNGAEYFVNAGQVRQQGIEASVWAYVLPLQPDRFLQSLQLQSALSYNHYRFGDYQVDDEDFNDNKVTAVPDWVWTNTLFFLLPKGIGLNINYNYTSAMPLNDANTVFAKQFHLIQVKGTFNWKIHSSLQLQFFAGIDNLLNQKYSLGNDINAFGNRFFNPAPPVNYYGGVKFNF